MGNDEGLIRFDSKQFVDLYAQYYGVREIDAKRALGSTTSLRILNLVALENGAINKYTREVVTNLNESMRKQQEDIDKEIAELNIKMNELCDMSEKLRAQKADVEKLMAEYQALQSTFGEMETPEMRDRVRALEFYKSMFTPETRQRNSYIQGCALILAGSYIVVEKDGSIKVAQKHAPEV